jgi:hypothetical protein
MVAFRWIENSTPRRLASVICCRRNATSARRLANVPSSTSPACSDSEPLSTVTMPSLATCSIRTVVAAGSVTDTSRRKSLALMVDTWVFESAGHGCMRGGFPAREFLH